MSHPEALVLWIPHLRGKSQTTCEFMNVINFTGKNCSSASACGVNGLPTPQVLWCQPHQPQATVFTEWVFVELVRRPFK